MNKDFLNFFKPDVTSSTDYLAESSFENEKKIFNKSEGWALIIQFNNQ
jgi:hypothetical protein